MAWRSIGLCAVMLFGVTPLPGVYNMLHNSNSAIPQSSKPTGKLPVEPCVMPWSERQYYAVAQWILADDYLSVEQFESFQRESTPTVQRSAE